MLYDELAGLLFPHIDKTPEYYEEKYPARALPAGARVTRLGPSPTGFIHLGNLYMALANERLAHQSGGVFFLRIEDTDSRREVEGAAESLVASLDYYGIRFDEGASAEGESGAYGPYRQSRRAEIYQCFVKKLVAEGKAYPCFLTEEEIAAIRGEQEAKKLMPGIYGAWAKHRDLPPEEVCRRIEAGAPWVIRFRAGREVWLAGPDEAAEARFSIEDGIRGILTLPKNRMDVVILKTGGLPTYHFAHVADDHLMRTTHVIRGEEWISSLPVHVALFEAMGWTPPAYCHTTVLMKTDGGLKRKLSKRKDPELSLEYYRKEGYHPLAVREYLLTVSNSDFEEWRLANPGAPAWDFTFTTDKMGHSGILFDMDKLRDVSKETLLKIPASGLADFLTEWACHAGLPEAAHLQKDKAYLEKILDIGRNGEKPRKDLAFGAQILDFIRYFYDELFQIEDPWPENIPPGDIPRLLSGYLAAYSQADDRTAWFERIRVLAEENGYAAKPKDFKKNPERYKGHVGDVSTVIRIALTGRANSPDLWEIQQILGESRTKARLSARL
ncbi:MAG: glutamate--tRNA ligase [Clostridiales Family XIII bacterium]|jgi:glutamyl-tRNA synthetase|nr:glutamate--tRNA ligase [Clostridiales Family XIII bacterium]